MRDKAPKSNTEKPAVAEPAELVRLSVAQVRANLRRVLEEKRPVFIERHGCIVGVLLPFERRCWPSGRDLPEQINLAASKLKAAQHACPGE